MTVQEKNVTFPTDNKFHRRIIEKCRRIATDEGLPVRQSYMLTLSQLTIDQRLRNHTKNKGRARKTDRRVKTIAGRLVRELERNLPEEHSYGGKLDVFNRVLAQTRQSKNKVYSIHEP